MDAPMQERNMFDHVTCNRSASVDEVTAPGALALDLIEQVRLHLKLSGRIAPWYQLFDLLCLTVSSNSG
jgi:hypothetical protein